MANYAQNRGAQKGAKLAIFTFFAFFLLLSALTNVYGRGGKEQDLVRADELIAEREFKEAVKILTEFARKNPDKFDLAQERLRIIYRTHGDFNLTADDLIVTLRNDPENNPRLMDLSRRLYELEHPESPLLTDFVARTREIAEFNVNRNRLLDILERGRRYLDAGDALAAMQTYATGMDFMREVFFTSGYGPVVENNVRRETERVNAMLAAFQQANSQILSLSQELSRAIPTGDMPRITQSITRLTPAITRIIELKGELYTAAAAYERILNTLQTDDPELRDRNHLAFLSVIINGRSGEDIQEGMLGAFDVSWQSSIGQSLNTLTAFIQNTNNSAILAFNTGQYAAAVASLERMDSYYNISLPFFDRHRQLFRGTQAQTTALLGNNILEQDINQYLELRTLNEANNTLRQASTTASRLNIDHTTLTRWQQGGIATPAALTAERQIRNNINGTQREIEQIISRAETTNTVITSVTDIPHLSRAITAVEGYLSSLSGEESQSVQRYYSIANGNIRNDLRTRNEEMTRSRNLLNGERTTNEAGVAVTYFYPTEALQLLNNMLNAITAELNNANTITAQYRQEPETITSNTAVSSINTSYQTAINEMNALREQGLALAETARTRSNQAEALRLDGERFFREAQAALQRQDFEVARDRVQRASESIARSLEIQEVPAMRIAWDNQLLDLGQTIARAENEVIIAEVRALVNNARTFYFAGNFQQAESTLIRARTRWGVTHTEENEEVVYWLAIIRTALSARSGRVIPQTAPLYAEMSQLLSQAQRNYEEGVNLINAGQRPVGLAKFDEALQMTREVRLMFPINQEAGILELRIEQFTDPAAFNAMFEQRLRTAIAGTRNASLEAYGELQNLAEINPRYPNMRAILTQAEIDMGFRPRPPNPANIARSRELTASVNRILDGNFTAMYANALADIDLAIALNPENIEATRTKDRLVNRMSVPGSIVLSTADEEIYQRAMRELQAGNNLVARTLVERLLENPRNQSIPKLIELQRRIQAIL